MTVQVGLKSEPRLSGFGGFLQWHLVSSALQDTQADYLAGWVWCGQLCGVDLRVQRPGWGVWVDPAAPWAVPRAHLPAALLGPTAWL